MNQTLIFPIKRFRSIAMHEVETPYQSEAYEAVGTNIMHYSVVPLSSCPE